MTYRRTDKPPFAAWLSAERRRHGLKAEEVARRLRDLGFPAEESTYRTWEAGRRPAQDTVIALERMFDSAAPGEDATGQGDLAAAFREQSQMLQAYVERTDHRIALLEQLVASLSGRPQLPAAVRQESEAFAREALSGSPLRPSVPVGTTE